ncbi:hypothetical protein GCM10023310_69690 [Paenibacillus vulneris]|uniref:Uncharacterized protein n=1 Tax=Paenibacillus vulneris TaxID=1133364 RepID=A0ABW3UFX5_9BACL
MSTYDSAYHSEKFPENSEITNSIIEQYEVISGRQIDVYHYHGSWFEYTWELTLRDNEGIIVKKDLDTWNNYNSLDGEKIEYDGYIFKAIN